MEGIENNKQENLDFAQDSEQLIAVMADNDMNEISTIKKNNEETKENNTEENNNEQNKKDLEQEQIEKSIMVNINELPEEIQDYYISSKEENFDKEKYTSEINRQKNLLSLDDKSFYELYIKSNFAKTEQNPDGLTEEEISNEVKNLSPLQLKLKVSELKKELETHFNNKRKERLSSINKPKEVNIEEYNKNIELVIEKNKDVKESFGYNFNDEVKKKVADEAYRQWNQVDTKTGKTKLDLALENEELRYKVIAILNQGEDNIKGDISELKESIKSSIIKKLGIEAKDLSGGSATGMSAEFNPNVFV